ncbi:hypothetical protein [Paenibacillus sp. UASWS1643]|uniref:hypothetical protein n=1 Tax=Paenibacillus sp. UASWS1643 TaxID=2580422 RepID=UPI00123C33B8|nr:hypothetical protein [Paenibacillus sp. UASWS1643]KAA8745356.1 hypothetical protein FE296_26045 [Paenibacillus sp. UASWS1643]
MIIQKVAVGNSEEAYVENNLSNYLNIISSDDNNRGKTILIQSLLFCLGNTPAFPSTFNYMNYYHIVVFSVEDKQYSLCRKSNSFILRNNQKIMMFDSISELKRYWTKNVFMLPTIIKNGLERIVDPELFYQLNFVGQDKKDTSNIANKNYYNKTDFFNMLYSFTNISTSTRILEDDDQAKEKIKNLKVERKNLLNQHKILKSNNPVASYLSSVNDKLNFRSKIEKVEKIKDQILELRKLRNAALSRKSKCEMTIKELQSLNRTIQSGELKCMDCNSTHINFKSADKDTYSFDVSTLEIRQQILESISEKIKAYSEDIENFTFEINKRQEEMNKILEQDEVSLELLVAFKNEMFSADDAEVRINIIDGEIKKIEADLLQNANVSKNLVQKQQDLIMNITGLMNDTYSNIDPSGNLEFESIFTKSNQIFSGSEATIYHLVKLYSFAKVLKYNLPVIVDSFRAEDLSTEKELLVLDIFSKLNVQVILTTTLKAEEVGKYNSMQFLNHIDYSKHTPSKILGEEHLKEFRALVEEFSLKL